MRGYPLVPGVIDVGHDTAAGWHPGPKADCPECKVPPEPPRPLPTPPAQIEVKVEVPIPNNGSDCLTGKVQYISRKAALAAAASLRYQHQRSSIHPFKCSWCLLWHTGNQDRSQASKNRGRR